MFGYVTVNKLELKVKEYQRYRGYYCGLCHVLKKRHGNIGRITLTYDMTFLIILLTSLYEKETIEEMQRCIVHPMKNHLAIWNEITEYAADMNVALTYHHLKDDWKDERNYLGLVGSGILSKKYNKIQQSYPRQCKAIEDTLDALMVCEKEKEQDIDKVSRCFGELMQAIFVYKEDIWHTYLGRIGFYLGKYIYLLDAYDDMEKDKKNNSYNPLLEWEKEEDFNERCQELLNMMMTECAKEFEKLPIEKELGILKNILYLGVWNKFDEKKYKTMKKEI